MKILIVDDSPDALRVARARLKNEPVTILTASGGKEGLDLARRESPDLCLLDVDMPDLSGFDLCRALKADPDCRLIPVIFLSGSTNAGDKVKGLDLGAVDYVTKPFDAFELRARVRAALRTKELQDLLARHARIDPLTKLPNRRALMDRLQQAWSRVRRHGGDLSLIMADVDRFKDINDSFGHTVGDRLLEMAAGAIASQCREADLAGKYGGDEFAIVVPDETADGAASLAERCRQAVERLRVDADDRQVATTASFGVAQMAPDDSMEALVERADAALYEAKAAGRNTVRTSGGETPGDDEATGRTPPRAAESGAGPAEQAVAARPDGGTASPAGRRRHGGEDAAVR